MLIYGFGGHGKVVLSAARSSGLQVDAFFDDHATCHTYQSRIPVYRYDSSIHSSKPLLVAIGYNPVREKIVELVSHSFCNIIHPSALVEQDSGIGTGNICLQRSIVQTQAVLGNHIIVNSGAIVEHDCKIDDFAHIAPGAILCGGVEVGRGTLVGAGSVVVPGVKIGAYCVIHAGAVVTRNVPDYSIVRNSPTRIVRPKQLINKY